MAQWAGQLTGWTAPWEVEVDVPVAAQGVLQQPGQLGVPVGHVSSPLALVSQSTDDIAQGQLQRKDRVRVAHLHAQPNTHRQAGTAQSKPRTGPLKPSQFLALLVGALVPVTERSDQDAGKELNVWSPKMQRG